MEASFNLIERNVKTVKAHPDQFDRNGSDKYELLFKVSTNQCDIEILNVECYVKSNYIFVYSDYGFRGSVEQFCEKFKSFMDGLMHGTNSEINFLEENAYFAGFTTLNGEIHSFSDESELTVPKGIYKIDNEFCENIQKIIDKLTLI